MDGVICPSGKRWRALIGTCRPQPADPRYPPILRSCRKVAPHGLLPNVRVHILGNLLLFFCRKRWRRQTGENFVENERPRCPPWSAPSPRIDPAVPIEP